MGNPEAPTAKGAVKERVVSASTAVQSAVYVSVHGFVPGRTHMCYPVLSRASAFTVAAS